MRAFFYAYPHMPIKNRFIDDEISRADSDQ